MGLDSKVLIISAATITVAVIIDVAVILYYRSQSLQNVTLAKEKFAEELKKEKDLREKERLGRISVQKRTRDRLTGQNLKLGYQYHPIGFVESPFPDRRGTPRQPVLVPAAMGKIRFDKSMIQAEHFKEMIQFSHIWVVFVFHENTNGDTKSSQVPARIKPPRLGGQKVGCLTTRSPHRPNAIGLSVCEVVEVGSDFIRVSGIDMVDGTPVLDIKPYIPYDSIRLEAREGDDPSESLPLPMSVAASFNGSIYEERKLKVPSWIIDSDVPLHPVAFDVSAIEALNDLILDRMLSHCSTSTEAVDLITQVFPQSEILQCPYFYRNCLRIFFIALLFSFLINRSFFTDRKVLRQDIRGVHQGRGKTMAVTACTIMNSELAEAPKAASYSKIVEYICRLDNMLLKFITTASEIRVISIELYRSPPLTEGLLAEVEDEDEDASVVV